MQNFKSVKDNTFYINYVNYNEYTNFYDLIIYTMVSLEEGINFNGPLHYIKYIKDESKIDRPNNSIGLLDCKYFYDFLRGSGFIDDDVFKINRCVFEINSITDVIKIIDNEITVEQFFRISKIKKLKKRISII